MRKDIEDALYTYLARKWKIEEPNGKTDKNGRWMPTWREKQRCCRMLKSPTATEPDTLKKHCCTIEHVAKLHKVDLGQLSSAALQEGSEQVLQRRRQ